jgi:hypothetical protein
MHKWKLAIPVLAIALLAAWYAFSYYRYCNHLPAWVRRSHSPLHELQDVERP